MESLVRYEGMIDMLLDALVKDGYFKTRSEIFRAGVLRIGEDYHMIEKLQDLARAEIIDSGIKSGKIKVHSESEWKNLVEKKKRD